MILNTSILKYSLAAGFTAISIFSFGQTQDTVSKPPTIEEVEVIRDYKPILADAVKIRRSPDLSNTRVFQPTLSYSTLNQKIDIPSGLSQLKIQEMPPIRPDAMTNNYAKIGIGNFNTYLGELYINTGTDETMQAGAFVKHLSQKGDIDGQKFAEQRLGVFGRNVLELFTLSGELGYNRYATNFYGFQPSISQAVNSFESQAFNDIYFKGELLKNYEPSADDVSYSLKAAGYFFNDAFSAKENSVALSGYFNKKLNTFNIGLNASIDLASVQNTDESIGNSISRINPYVRFKNDNYKITLGANLVTEFGDGTTTNLLPSAELELDVVPSYLTVFGGIHGDVRKTSLRDLTRENPYLAEDIVVKNQLEKINAYAGVKGNAGATLGYKAGISYKKIDNLPFFVNNATTPEKFDVIYDEDEETTVVGFEGEVNIRVSETVNLGGKINISEYTLAEEKFAWFMPKAQVSSFARINISDKIFVDSEVLFTGETKAKELDIHDINNFTVKSMPAFVDLSGAIEYRIDRKFGIYVRANNLLGNGYERYLHYPRLGLNVIGGLNYSF